MTERLVLYTKDLQEKVKVFIMGYLKDVSPDQFLNQAFSKFRSNLQSINSKGEKNFNDSFNVVLSAMLFQLSFMFLDDTLADEFCTFYFTFVDDDFVVFAQLYFIIFDGFIQGFVLRATFLNVMDDLQEVDGN